MSALVVIAHEHTETDCVLYPEESENFQVDLGQFWWMPVISQLGVKLDIFCK